MRNEFIVETRTAMAQLRVKQRAHLRLKDRSEARLQKAQARHTASVAHAEMVEARAWMDLLEIPGVAIPTAAALMDVSESTVSRWVARYNRGLEERRAASAAGAS